MLDFTMKNILIVTVVNYGPNSGEYPKAQVLGSFKDVVDAWAAIDKDKELYEQYASRLGLSLKISQPGRLVFKNGVRLEYCIHDVSVDI